MSLANLRRAICWLFTPEEAPTFLSRTLGEASLIRQSLPTAGRQPWEKKVFNFCELCLSRCSADLPGKRQILSTQWAPSTWQCASVVDASVMLDRYGHGCHILGGRRSRSNVRGVWGLGNRATAAFFNCYWSHTNNSICYIPFTMTQSPYEGTIINSEMQKYVKIIRLILVTLILVCFWAVFIKTQKRVRLSSMDLYHLRNPSSF